MNIKSIIIVFSMISLIAAYGCQNKKQETKSVEKVAKAPATREELKPGKEISADQVKVDIPIDTVIGKWLRPDGNYILNIKAISKNGDVEAEYLNPRPVKIAMAKAVKEGVVKVFIEFNDKGYEGSLYDLYYDDTQDLLLGSYFQATMGQTYQIAFMRYNK